MKSQPRGLDLRSGAVYGVRRKHCSCSPELRRRGPGARRSSGKRPGRLGSPDPALPRPDLAGDAARRRRPVGGAAAGARRRWGAGDAGDGGPATREKKRGAAEGSGPVGRGGGLPAGSGGPARPRRCGRPSGTRGAAALAEAGGGVERTLSGAGRTRPSAAEEGDLFFLARV